MTLRLPRNLAGSTPLALASLLIGLFVLSAAAGTAWVADAVSGLLTRQIFSTLTFEGKAVQDIERIAGPDAVKPLIEARSAAASRGHSYILLDERGRRIAGRAVDSAAFRSSRGGAVIDLSATTPSAGQPTLAAAVEFELAAGRRLIVVRELGSMQRFAERLRWGLLGALTLVTVGGLGLAFGLGMRQSRRIAAVTATADRIMAGDLSQRIPPSGGGDEIDALSERLNQMLERIESLVAGMREISDNIAHDLKTPLGRLRNRAEAALRASGGADAARAGLERTIEQADEIIATFNALLLIARVEAGAVADSFSTFDVSALAHDVAELYAPVAEEAGQRLAADITPGLKLTANRELIGQALSNLVDNAIKYGRASTVKGAPAGDIVLAVTAAATDAGRDIIIRIADRGPGIPPADRERVLRRFVRLDQSRTAPGTGLGLSLVAAVARLHNARLTLGDNAPGLVVELELPGGGESGRRG